MGSLAYYSTNLRLVKENTNESKLLASIHNDIYYENDNSEIKNYVITQEFIDSLKVGDKLELSADGNG